MVRWYFVLLFLFFFGALVSAMIYLLYFEERFFLEESSSHPIRLYESNVRRYLLPQNRGRVTLFRSCASELSYFPSLHRLLERSFEVEIQTLQPSLLVKPEGSTTPSFSWEQKGRPLKETFLAGKELLIALPEKNGTIHELSIQQKEPGDGQLCLDGKSSSMTIDFLENDPQVKLKEFHFNLYDR